jgi:septum formation inhibitor-activating ATPase MinD
MLDIKDVLSSLSKILGIIVADESTILKCQGDGRILVVSKEERSRKMKDLVYVVNKSFVLTILNSVKFV